MCAQGFEKAIVTGKGALLHFVNPAGEPAFAFGVGLHLIEKCRQLFAEGVGLMQVGACKKSRRKRMSFLFLQVRVIFAQQPEGAFAILVIGFLGELLFIR